MKKFLLLSFAALMFVFSVNAQNAGKTKRTAAERAEALTKRMTTQLSLDAAQQERIKVINQQTAQKIDAARAELKGKENAAARAEKVKSVEAERETLFKQVLKEEQFNKYVEMRKKAMSKMGKKGKKAAVTEAAALDEVEE
ncbi:hypothetical protein SAMN05421780_101469 [Flexibacter flexilis DSM 6793]|uniref:DUF4890 domain-containing protein n=1 Tax=Flexibacter flexilis DSM 6793 TaxID=927664 RepID=A0A1I1DVR8_9BACT|nr:hypothetical protein [Flexibacter flexilis]SFB78496.1 hypothetical protein SAMN05421780_101469 [Flexibacter flexilis DSM 6793]